MGAALALRFRKSAWCEHETVLVFADRDGVVLRGATVSRLPEEFAAPALDGAQRAAVLFNPALGECLAGLSPAELRDLDCRFDNFIDREREAFPQLVREAFPSLPLAPEQSLRDTTGQLGRCAFFERIVTAAEELRTGKRERILVGCVDSLCTTSWLMTVRDEGILKDSFTPEGLIAGEAAGAVLLERESTARNRNARVLAVLSSWGRGTETESWHGSIPVTGRGLSEAFHQALSVLDGGGKSIAAVIADLNGQRQRALDWAYTEGRVFQDKEEEGELRLPAFITGDCGGAMGAVLLADALGRFAFHPRFRGRLALSASDDSGARRVICLEAGDVLANRRQMMRQIRTQVQGKLSRK